VEMKAAVEASRIRDVAKLAALAKTVSAVPTASAKEVKNVARRTESVPRRKGKLATEDRPRRDAEKRDARVTIASVARAASAKVGKSCRKAIRARVRSRRAKDVENRDALVTIVSVEPIASVESKLERFVWIPPCRT